MTLKKKMLKGIFWSLLERGGQQILSFCLFILIARLIGPEEYGLVMISFIYLSFVSLLQLGLADSVVTLQLKDKEKLSTLFWVSIGFGILLSFFCFILSGSVAKALNEPELEYLLNWLSVVSVLVSIQSIPHMLVMQSLSFKVYAIRTLLATLISGIVGVYLAFTDFGALAMIFQQIVLYAISNVILWTYIDWRPSFTFKNNVIKTVILPGYKMMLSNTFTFLEQQLPRLFLGDFLGPKKVAYFSFAFRMRYALQDILINPAFIVLFPALSKLKGNSVEQDKILGMFFFIIGVIIFPIVAIAVITAPIYIHLLVGTEWVAAVPILQIFLGIGILSPFISMASVLFRVHNKVNIFLQGQVFIVSSSLIIIYFLSQFSLMAVSLTVFIFTVISVPLYFLLLYKSLNIKLIHHFYQLKVSVLISITMSIVVQFLMTTDFLNFNSWSGLFLILFIGCFLCLLLNFLFQGEKIKHVFSSFKGVLNDRS